MTTHQDVETLKSWSPSVSHGDYGQPEVRVGDSERNHSELKSPAFQKAALHSERARTVAVLFVLASLLALVVARGAMAFAAGRRGESWPFAVALAAMTIHEAVWLRSIGRAIHTGRELPGAAWMGNIFVELSLPTLMLLL